MISFSVFSGVVSWIHRLPLCFTTCSYYPPYIAKKSRLPKMHFYWLANGWEPHCCWCWWWWWCRTCALHNITSRSYITLLYGTTYKTVRTYHLWSKCLWSDANILSSDEDRKSRLLDRLPSQVQLAFRRCPQFWKPVKRKTSTFGSLSLAPKNRTFLATRHLDYSGHRKFLPNVDSSKHVSGMSGTLWSLLHTGT